MREEHVFDLLPGYALGSLDEADLLTVARHLPHCATCQAELAAYRDTLGSLALAAPPRNPPADLRGRVLARVDQAAGFNSTAQREQAAPRAQPRKAGWWESLRAAFRQPVGAALVGLALLLILFLGISNLLLWQRVNDLQARVPAGDVHVVQLTGTAAAPQTVGYLTMFPNNPYGTLTVNNAPVLDPGHQYQIWLIHDGQRASGGVFSVNEVGYGVLQINANRPLDSYQSFGITVEPAGGSPAPTGKKVLGGKL